jgi:hypothetical protein
MNVDCARCAGSKRWARCVDGRRWRPVEDSCDGLGRGTARRRVVAVSQHLVRYIELSGLRWEYPTDVDVGGAEWEAVRDLLAAIDEAVGPKLGESWVMAPEADRDRWLGATRDYLACRRAVGSAARAARDELHRPRGIRGLLQRGPSRAAQDAYDATVGELRRRVVAAYEAYRSVRPTSPTTSPQTRSADAARRTSRNGRKLNGGLS